MRIPDLIEKGAIEPAGARREPVPAWQAWLETLALVATPVAIGALLDRRDPFLLQRGFSWLTLAPVLAGSQHGSTRGLACGALQALALAIASRFDLTPMPDSFMEMVLGWLLAGFVAGEFHDSWLRRCRHSEASADQLRLRHEDLGSAYLALKASHDRLQRDTPGRPVSLRDALAAFRRELADRSELPSLESLGRRILALFCEHAFVRAGALHLVDARGRPGPAIASLGDCGAVEPDPLVCKAARDGITVSVRNAGEGSLLLAAVPLVDVGGRVHAVLAVRDMPFVALHAETLELLAMLGGHLGDVVFRAAAQAAPPPTIQIASSRPAHASPIGSAAIEEVA
jgi:hypothetical protein